MSKQALLQQYIEAKAAGDHQRMEMLADQVRALHPRPERGPSIAAGTTRAAAQGATFGFADEIEAGARALVQDATYEEIRDEIRESNAQFREEHPALSYGAELGAGFLVPGGAVRGAAAAARSGGALGRLAQAAGRMAPQSRTGQLVGGGAAAGAAAGLGTSEEESLGGMAVDTALGAGLGAGLGGAGRFIEGRLAGAAERLGGRAMRRAREGSTPEALAAEVAGLGPASTLAETGENMRQLAGDALRTTSPRAQQYREFLERRTQGGAQRIAQEVTDASGVPAGTTRQSAKEALEALKDREAEVLYGRVRQQAQGSPVNVSQRQRDMIRHDPQGRQAAADALLRFQRRSGNYELELEDVEHTFDFWHEVQRELRERASTMGTPTQQGTTRSAGGDIGRMRDELMDEMKTRNPWGEDYGTATIAYRNRMEQLEALGDSEKFMNMPNADLEQLTARMTPADREAFTQGVVADILHKIAKAPESANTARNIVKSELTRENLKTLLGDVAGERLIQRLRNEAEKIITNTKVMGNSETAIRQAFSGIFNRPGLGDVARNLLPGGEGTGAAIRNVVDMTTGPGGGTAAMDPRAAANVLDVLQLQDPAQIAGAIRRLEQRGAGAGRLPMLPGALSGVPTTLMQEY